MRFIFVIKTKIMDILIHLILLIVPTSAIIYIVYLFLKKQSEKDIVSIKLELKKERQNLTHLKIIADLDRLENAKQTRFFTEIELLW